MPKSSGDLCNDGSGQTQLSGAPLNTESFSYAGTHLLSTYLNALLNNLITVIQKARAICHLPSSFHA